MKTYRSPSVDSRSILLVFKVLHDNLQYYAKRCQKMFLRLANGE